MTLKQKENIHNIQYLHSSLLCLCEQQEGNSIAEIQSFKNVEIDR